MDAEISERFQEEKVNSYTWFMTKPARVCNLLYTGFIPQFQDNLCPPQIDMQTISKRKFGGGKGEWNCEPAGPPGWEPSCLVDVIRFTKFYLEDTNWN